jgi:site-specific DNA-methyltransferase (adenine-specific)
MEPQTFLDGRVTLHAGDCLDVLRGLPDGAFDSVVTDPPYALVSIVKRFGKAGAKPTRDGDVYSRASAGFMGKAWDTGERAFAVEFWQEVYRVLKPGGHVVAFAGTRTYHRLACAVEDAGFDIRDQIGWLYGSGFPKSHDVSKGIDRHNGDKRPIVGRERLANDIRGGALLDAAHGGVRPGYERDITAPGSSVSAAWQGWGTALKPAWEPIVLARKPLAGTVAENVLEHGTGAMNIDGCRVGDEVREAAFTSLAPCHGNRLGDADTAAARRGTQGEPKTYVGRWPANVVHDGSDEVVAAFPESAGQQGDVRGSEPSSPMGGNTFGRMDLRIPAAARGDTGSAARFFYSAKADAHDRIGSKPPTVKPVDLMQWLVRLVTPKGGMVLDPFAGTGTTGEAAWREGMRAVLVEREEEYRADIARRMRLADSPFARAAAVAAAKPRPAPCAPTLFDVMEAPPLAPDLSTNQPEEA